MLFGKKEKAVPELLQKQNIILDCKAMPKDQVIEQIGKMLTDSGYVDASYTNAMKEREKTFATYMGNGIALPHGVESAKAAVKNSGIAIMVFPEGTEWSGEMAKVVIGIAGKGDEHLDILSNVALKLGEDGAVEKFLEMNKDQMYELLTRKED
ncbi:MAG: PTS sugar transporter subunit IIA [Hespellia sp.]|nr:PTS sugar transporter subunit IIA [Hespellia sp.]